ncbi:hypothetical protein BDEG_26971 [Batrachochytrium dendrobatidis JEL423]|uniref:Phorbol-ester/DAG-type domain-containing protein n=1 Tax=Batrachochytrium dendrobatidis (strain JEL423) TaxID=403673 RepID=A0A177WU50_BATDL|nr:hypothetical protein BDEG_26971 [Batrachochytrium dendrobatidis JEL423]
MQDSISGISSDEIVDNPKLLDNPSSSNSAVPKDDVFGIVTTAIETQTTDSLFVEPSKNSLQSHDFRPTTFHQPTSCDLCFQFIWELMGCSTLSNKLWFGYTVITTQECAYDVHYGCKAFVSTKCYPKGALFELDSAKPSKSIQQKSTLVSSKPPAIDSTESIKSRHVSRSSIQESNTLVSELLVKALQESDKAEQQLKDLNPPLGVMTMLEVNSKFVARQGPLIWIQNTATDIIMWRNPVTTVWFILGYILVCTSPILFSILPQIGILYVITTSYLDRVKKLSMGETIPPPDTPHKITMTNTQYLAHLQHIQNTMLSMVSAYDSGYTFYLALNWSDPDKTNRMLYSTLVSMLISILVFSLIPFHQVLLWGGVGLFAANTAIIKAAGITLTPVILDKLQKQVLTFKKHIHTVRQTESTTTNIEVIIFENQRWWAGMGFVPLLLHIERPAWSDATGLLPLPPKNAYQLPSKTETVKVDKNGHEVRKQQTWKWVDDTWEVDMKWTHVNSEGWQFCNQTWQDPRAKPSLGSFTRRRKWIRRMHMVQ